MPFTHSQYVEGMRKRYGKSLINYEWVARLMLGHLGKTRALVIIGLIIAAPAVYWLASPLFINVQVNESVPSTTGGQLNSSAEGTFVDADSFHRTSGTATIVQSGDGSRLLQLSQFRTINGPDLFVYLATDTTAKDIVNLGPLKGNLGDQHYQIPPNADLSRYRYVLIWCRTFAVLFGSAQLS